MSVNISLSFELILLINWLLKNEKNNINNLVKHALENGFMQELEKASHQEAQQTPDAFYTSILDFLLHLEEALVKNIESINIDESTNKAIQPVIKKIDLENFDLKTVWLSMQQTKNRISKEAEKNDLVTDDSEKINSLLFEQLLKNWKPNKKDLQN